MHHNVYLHQNEKLLHLTTLFVEYLANIFPLCIFLRIHLFNFLFFLNRSYIFQSLIKKPKYFKAQNIGIFKDRILKLKYRETKIYPQAFFL